ncbi:MAG: lipid-A-disaccharide synthase [Bdellovibrionales bacterium]
MIRENKQQVLVIAGETSSSLYALRVIQKLKESHPDLHFFGVGSKAMEAEGFECVGRSEDMAVMGLQEVVSHYFEIKKIFNKLVDLVKTRKPSFILLLDYSGFNLRFAEKVHGQGVPIVYYISPQLWAWRTGRVQIVKKFIDKMLVVFPFERTFYEQHGVTVEFVGHPLLDELTEDLYETSMRNENRSRYGFNLNDKVIGLLPGSRTSELKMNLESQIRAAEILYRKNRQLKFIVAVAPNFTIEEFKTHLPDIKDLPLVLVKKDPFEMIRMADVVLTASGTATLMVGLMHTPMVIMYKMKPLTAWLAKKLVKGTKYFGMINLILGEEVCKELFQENAAPEIMAAELENLLDESVYVEKVNKLKRVNQLLGEKGATERVVEHLTKYLK